jgi:hypothetical protein
MNMTGTPSEIKVAPGMAIWLTVGIVKFGGGLSHHGKINH